MKFEMTWSEFDSFCGRLATGANDNRVNALEVEIQQLRKFCSDLQKNLTHNRVKLGLSEAFSLFRENKKIAAIKEIRSTFDLGLKEAKDIVEGVFTTSNTNSGGVADTDLRTLSSLFKEYYSVPTNTLRERLATLVNYGGTPNEDLDRIFTGTYHTR